MYSQSNSKRLWGKDINLVLLVQDLVLEIKGSNSFWLANLAKGSDFFFSSLSLFTTTSQLQFVIFHKVEFLKLKA